MGLEGVSQVSVFNLKQALKKLHPGLKDDEAFYLSRYIGRGNNQIPIENVLEVLHLSDLNDNHVQVDQEWEEKFLGRIKRKMFDR